MGDAFASSARDRRFRPAHAAARHLADDNRTALAFILYGLALWIWHIPALYDAALEHEVVHVVQHLCFFGTAALFWWGIVHGRQGRLGYGAAVVYLFVTAVHGGVLGALLTVSPRVWYVPYLVQHPAGLTPLEDQQLAGLLMWIPPVLAFAAGALFLFAAWLRQSDRVSRFQSGPSLRPPIVDEHTQRSVTRVVLALFLVRRSGAGGSPICQEVAADRDR